MKPRNKFQEKVLKLSQSLSSLNEYQRQNAIKKIAPHIAKYNSKKEYVCLDCGHSWTGEKMKKVVCPHCLSKLKVDSSRKWNYCEKDYFAIVTKCQGFQVIRMFFMQTNLRRGKKATYWMEEAFQNWITPDGNTAIIGRTRQGLTRYCDSWNWHSEMEIRNESAGHHVAPTGIVGHSSVIPAIKRNGFKGDFHNCNPNAICRKLLTDNRVETVWKVGQYRLVQHTLANSYEFSKYWHSIKVAIRHKYQIKDPSLWYDMLNAMNYLGKDILNPKFICPENLKKSHDEWIAKKRAKEAQEARRREREREMAEERRYLENLKKVEHDEIQYKTAMSTFFDLEFIDNEIVIKPLTSVKEFMEEGRSLHHCVFTNQYYLRNDVLILHALVDNTSIATIEFSLENYSVIQCRGAYNSKPAMYDRIMSLIKKSTPQIMSKRT